MELSEVVDSVFSECSVFEDVDTEVDTGKSTKLDQEKGHEHEQLCNGDYNKWERESLKPNGRFSGS